MFLFFAGTGVVSRFLRENGITLTKVREESIRLLGKGDLYFFSPEHPPLTDSAQKALDWALDQKLRSGTNSVHINFLLFSMCDYNLFTIVIEILAVNDDINVLFGNWY